MAWSSGSISSQGNWSQIDPNVSEYRIADRRVSALNVRDVRVVIVQA
jgi:hypothetical protein